MARPRIQAPERVARLRGRAAVVRTVLEWGADTSIGRLGILWFRRYMESTVNSGTTATVNLVLGAGPLLLAAVGVYNAGGGDSAAIADHFIARQHLSGEAAQVMRETFGTASHNARAAGAVAVLGFLLWGIAVAPLYQDVYAKAWRITPRRLSDQLRFAIWFLVITALLGLFVPFSANTRQVGFVLSFPVWFVVSTLFWLWTPLYLLHWQIGWRRLLPGALASSVVVGGAMGLSPFFLGSSLSSDGRHFGAFGIVLALFAWALVLTTLTMVCAVFSPVWEEWRASERARNEKIQ